MIKDPPSSIIKLTTYINNCLEGSEQNWGSEEGGGAIKNNFVPNSLLTYLSNIEGFCIILGLCLWTLAGYRRKVQIRGPTALTLREKVVGSNRTNFSFALLGKENLRPHSLETVVTVFSLGSVFITHPKVMRSAGNDFVDLSLCEPLETFLWQCRLHC